MKTFLMRAVIALVSLAAVTVLVLYLTVYPRHYTAGEFDNMTDMVDVAARLRGGVERGVLPVADWPKAFQGIGVEEVRVYPSGVLIKLRGFFTFESGLYFPSERVADKIDSKPTPVYQRLKQGVYSYKLEM